MVLRSPIPKWFIKANNPTVHANITGIVSAMELEHIYTMLGSRPLHVSLPSAQVLNPRIQLLYQFADRISYDQKPGVFFTVTCVCDVA